MSPSIRNQAKLAGIALAAVFLFATSASAQNVHLKPPNRDPIFTDNGLTLSVMGELAGLGFGDVLIDMVAQANATAVCINPGSGEQQPPGQQPAPVTVGGQQVIPEEEIKNGNTPFAVTTVAPVSPRPAVPPECPGVNWTLAITDLAFTMAVITVFQPAIDGVVVLTVTCTFDPPTANGPVPRDDVSCDVVS